MVIKSKERTMTVKTSVNNLKSESVLQTARNLILQNEEYESMKTLVDFMNIPVWYMDTNSKVIEFLVSYILSPLQYEENFSDEDYRQRLARLQTFVRAVLGIPKDEQCVGSIVTHEMSKSFEAVVHYFTQSIDKLRPRNQDRPFDHDLGSDACYFIPPESHKQINLGINYWPTLHSLIGPSCCPGKLYAFHLTQAIRMVSIMFGVNKHWGTLFGNVTKRQIVPNSVFGKLNIGYDEMEKYLWNEELQGYYPFLFKAEIRQEIYYDNTVNIYFGEVVRKPYDRIRFSVSRSDTLEIADKVVLTDNAIPYWFFSFKNEKGEGRGPTREFYTKFSKDIKKYDLNLWIGERDLSSDGINYVNSPCGLFPSPCLQLDERSKNILVATGKLMAKALIDNMLMDLNFSNALYKYLIEGDNRVQCLNLSDLKDVMPSLVKFVDGLVSLNKEAERTKSDSSLTAKEQQDALSNLKYDGCPFEDLCINFTVPGYPDIEMVEGGAEKLLTGDNIEEYLQLITWWLLYKGPQEKIECIRSGYKLILNDEYFVSILPEDLDNMLCGGGMQAWTIEELRQYCVLSRGLALDSPVIEYLFQALITFSSEEQKQFLKFVTGSPNLPVGGLYSLKPRLTIDTFLTEGNPNRYLPMAMTCAHLLILPKFTNQEVLKRKLVRVFREGADWFEIS